MGRVKIPYYAVKNGRGFWQPTAAMREAGFEPVTCGPDGPEAWQKAAQCNARWKEHATARPKQIIPQMPIGSIAEGFLRYRGTGEWMTKAERTREEWERAWVHIERVFGDAPPSPWNILAPFVRRSSGMCPAGKRTEVLRFGARFGE